MTGHHLVDLLIALSNCRWLVLGVLVAHGQFVKKGGFTKEDENQELSYACLKEEDGVDGSVISMPSRSWDLPWFYRPSVGHGCCDQGSSWSERE